MGALAGVVGLGMSIGGASLSANAADNANHIRDAAIGWADMPIDVNRAYSQAFDTMEKYAPRSRALVDAQNVYSNEQFQKLLRQSIPGWDALQASRIRNAQSLANGVIPDDVLRQIQRSAAGKAVAGGYGGSQAARNLEARDLGRTSLDLTNMGNTQIGQIIGSTPMPQYNSDIYKYSAVDPNKLMQFQENQLNRMVASRFQRADGTSGDQVWGGFLQQQGGAMQGGAAGGGGGGGMMSMLGGMCWVAREVFGMHSPEWLMFRQWLVDCAPDWFRNLYLEHGESFAAWISDKPRIKSVVRWWMRTRIEKWTAAYG